MSNRPEHSKYRCCPLCHGKEVELLHNIDFVKQPWEVLPAQYRIVQCSICSLVYDDMDADQALFDQHYRTQQKYVRNGAAGAGGNTEVDLERYLNTASFLSKFIDKTAHILDVGCGKGSLLHTLSQHKYINLTGTDASEDCVEFIKTSFPFAAFCSPLQKLPTDKKYDLIIVSQVLEHIYDLDGAITRLTALCKPGGFLYIDVPNSSRYVDFFHGAYAYFDIEHINHFNYFTLKSLGEKYGFKEVASWPYISYIEKDIAYPNIGIIFKNTGIKSWFLPASPTASNNEIQCYIKRSQDYELHLKLPISPETPVFLWGMGAYGMRLMNTGIFDELNILGLIDSDINKQGNYLKGIEIYSPSVLKEYNNADTAVIIVSIGYRAQITGELEAIPWKGSIHYYL